MHFLYGTTLLQIAYFEPKWLTGSFENNFLVLASDFVGPVDGLSFGVRPVYHVIKHSHRERARGLGQLQQLHIGKTWRGKDMDHFSANNDNRGYPFVAGGVWVQIYRPTLCMFFKTLQIFIPTRQKPHQSNKAKTNWINRWNLASLLLDWNKNLHSHRAFLERFDTMP